MSAPRLPRRRKARADQRGVALIMVLGALTVLTVFLVELQEETSSELSAALAERDALKAEYHARSAVNLARLLIATEPTIRRSIAPLFMLMKKKPPQLPVWEFSDMVLGPFNDATGAAAFAAMSGLDTTTGKNLGLSGGGHFELKIVDEESKINLNNGARDTLSQNRLGTQLIGLMAPQQYDTLFTGRDGDDQFSDRATICGALVDWVDDNESLFPCDPKATGASTGAEDNYYQMLGLDYRRKNAPLDSIDEIRLVRGMSEDFWSTFVDPDPADPHKRILTVYGKGTVNPNTANALTLLAVVCGNAVEATDDLCHDPTQMQAFVMGVTLAKSIVPGAPVFATPGDFVSAMEGKGMIGPVLTTLGVKPVQFKSKNELKKMLATESKMFSIYAEGVVPGNRRTTRVRIHAVIDTSHAEELGGAMPQIFGGQPSTTPTTAGNPTRDQGGNNARPEEATPEAIASALAANPAGTVIYWRVE